MAYYKFLIFLPLLLLVGCQRVNGQTITINGQNFFVEIADTPAEQYLGLSRRKNLCDTCGMLFVFQDQSQPQFVMRQMNFALDFIWIENGRIVQIDKNALPENPVVTYYQPSTKIDQVLEVPAGTAEKFGWEEGAVVDF